MIFSKLIIVLLFVAINVGCTWKSHKTLQEEDNVTVQVDNTAKIESEVDEETLTSVKLVNQANDIYDVNGLSKQELIFISESGSLYRLNRTPKKLPCMVYGEDNGIEIFYRENQLITFSRKFEPVTESESSFYNRIYKALSVYPFVMQQCLSASTYSGNGYVRSISYRPFIKCKVIDFTIRRENEIL